MFRDNEPLVRKLVKPGAVLLLASSALVGCATNSGDKSPQTPSVTASSSELPSSPNPSVSSSLEASPSQSASPTESVVEVTGSYAEARQYLIESTPSLKNSDIWKSIDGNSAEFFIKNNISLPLLVDTANFTAQISEYIKANPDTSQDQSLRDIDYQTYHSIALVLNKAATNDAITSKLASEEPTIQVQVANLIEKDPATVFFSWKVATPNLYDPILPNESSITSEEIINKYPVAKNSALPEYTRILRTFAAYTLYRSHLLNEFSIDTYLSPNS